MQSRCHREREATAAKKRRGSMGGSGCGEVRMKGALNRTHDRR